MCRGSSLLERCIKSEYSAKNIQKNFQRKDRGHDTAEVLGLDAAVLHPWDVALTHRRADTMQVRLPLHTHSRERLRHYCF